MGMTAHVVYTAWDPERPASLSPIVIGDIIRGRIGFDGFLMSDDIGMEALAGRLRAAAPPACVAAGCDVALHCSGKMEEMVAVAERGAGDERRRAKRGWPGRWRRPWLDDDGADFAEAVAKRDALLALV